MKSQYEAVERAERDEERISVLAEIAESASEVAYRLQHPGLYSVAQVQACKAELATSIKWARAMGISQVEIAKAVRS